MPFPDSARSGSSSPPRYPSTPSTTASPACSTAHSPSARSAPSAPAYRTPPASSRSPRSSSHSDCPPHPSPAPGSCSSSSGSPSRPWYPSVVVPICAKLAARRPLTAFDQVARHRRRYPSTPSTPGHLRARRRTRRQLRRRRRCLRIRCGTRQPGTSPASAPQLSALPNPKPAATGPAEGCTRSSIASLVLGDAGTRS